MALFFIGDRHDERQAMVVQRMDNFIQWIIKSLSLLFSAPLMVHRTLNLMLQISLFQHTGHDDKEDGYQLKD